MGISQWPESERPREKLINKGASTLSDAELLAIFLRTGVKGISAVELSRQLLHRFGGLRPLLDASQEHFCAGHGLGVAKYAQLQAVLEMARRHLLAALEKGSALDSPQATRDYLRARLRSAKQELFLCLYLDNRHRVIADEILFYGTIDGAAVYPREVVRRSLQRNAAAVIFAHNHPSGIAEPSHADKQITQRLISALQLVEIRVLDHIVVGDNEEVSFAERGLL